VFEEEKKVNDAGGLLREFIHLICKEVFKAEKGKMKRLMWFLFNHRVVYKIRDTRCDI